MQELLDGDDGDSAIGSQRSAESEAKAAAANGAGSNSPGSSGNKRRRDEAEDAAAEVEAGSRPASKKARTPAKPKASS